MGLRKQCAVAFFVLSVSLCLADNVSVVYGEPEYTISENGIKTVYFTPNLCSRDTAESLPVSDKLILALNLTEEATVLSFQVATVGQADTQQQEQIVVRVGDVQPEAGPSDNTLCSIANVNSSSIMTTFDCETPLNGSFITVTKNDGGSMDICGFSATLSDDSMTDGPFLSANPSQVMGLENDNMGEPDTTQQVFAESPEIVFVQTPPLVFAEAQAPEIVFVQTPPLVFAEEPVANDVLVFGGDSFRENNMNDPQGPAAANLPLPSPAASPLQEANVFLSQGPAPGPSVLAPSASLVLPSLSPSATVNVSSIISSISTDSAVTELNQTSGSFAPAPGPGPAQASAPQALDGAAVQPIISFAGSPQTPSSTPAAPVPAPAVAPVSAPSAGPVQPVLTFASSQTQAAAPVPAPATAPATAPGPAPVPAQVQPVISFAAGLQTAATPAPVPAPQAGAVSGVAPGSSPAGLITLPAVPSPGPAPGPSNGAQQTVLVFASNSQAPAPAPVPASAPAPVPQVQQAVPVATGPASFSRANLIADQPQSPPPPTTTPSGSSSSSSQSNTSKGSHLSGGDKAGIAVGVIAGVALIAGATYFIIRRR